MSFPTSVISVPCKVVTKGINIPSDFNEVEFYYFNKSLNQFQIYTIRKILETNFYDDFSFNDRSKILENFINQASWDNFPQEKPRYEIEKIKICK